MKALIYLLQVSACTGTFYLFYYLFLRRLTFFTINRWYLLATLLISFVIPAITIPVSAAGPSAIMQPVIYIQHAQIVNEPVQLIVNNKAATDNRINWMLTLRYIYMVMALISITHLIISLVLFFWRTKSEKLLQIGHVKVLKADKLLGNSSFLNVIFINDAGLEPDEIKQIIAHELLHVSLYHSADRLIARLVQVILWFNPFAYLYIRAMEENHEFEVDRKAASNDDKGIYASLLFKLATSGQDYLFHGFSKVPIKKRIVMLFNQPTKNMKKAVYLFMLPLVAISCLAFANLKKDDKGVDTVGVKQHKITQWNADTILKRIQRFYTPARLANLSKQQRAEVAYLYTDDARQKRELASAIMNQKAVTLKITGINKDKKGQPTGFIAQYNSHEYNIVSNYGQEKQLNTLLKPGDEVTITPFHCDFMFQKDKLVTITPATVVKDGQKIFQLAEADKIPDYPFLYEVNKVRFAEGQVSNIVKYRNGKWKSALFETVNGYKFNLHFKPGAPNLSAIADDDHVRLRFVHEVKTGAKEYKINDWVSIKTYQQEYKNPDLFSKYYTDAIKANEKPRHLGAIYLKADDPNNPKDFSRGWYELTPRNWKNFMSDKARSFKDDDDLEALLTPREINSFIKKITDVYDVKFRLPTENELKLAFAKYYTRLHLGMGYAMYDKIIIRTKSGSSASTIVTPGGKAGFFIDKTYYSEDAIKKLPPSTIDSLGHSVGVRDIVQKDYPGVNLYGYQAMFFFRINGVPPEMEKPDYPWERQIPELSKSFGAIKPGGQAVGVIKPNVAIEDEQYEVRPRLWVGNQTGISIKTLSGKPIFPNFKSEAPTAVLAEYHAILKKYNLDTPANHPRLERSPFSVEDQKKLENLFGKMSERQQFHQLVFFFDKFNSLPKAPVSQRDFADFKRHPNYAIWIDNKRVKNSELAKFKPSDFSFCTYVYLPPVAAKNENADWEVTLMTPAFFAKYRKEQAGKQVRYMMPVSLYQGKI